MVGRKTNKKIELDKIFRTKLLIHMITFLDLTTCKFYVSIIDCKLLSEPFNLRAQNELAFVLFGKFRLI